jgi:uncharacterized protein YcbX
MLLSRIDLYPIKSLDGVSVTEVCISAGGTLENDRIYAIVDDAGAYLNGKRTGQVHLLRTTFADSYKEASFWVNGDDRKQDFVLAEPGRLNRWLSEFFGFRVKLIFEPRNGFPDDCVASGPTITSEASLQEVTHWFPELNLKSVRRRFRTNLELGEVDPFWEDHLFGPANELKPFSIGNITFFGHNPCQRCVVPSRDPESGAQLVPSFQRTFMTLRKKRLPSWANADRFNHFYRFAVNTSLPPSEEGKYLRVGDPIRL